MPSRSTQRSSRPRRGGSQLGPAGIGVIALLVVLYLLSDHFGWGLFPNSTATPSATHAATSTARGATTTQPPRTVVSDGSVPSGLPNTAEAATVVSATDGDTIKVDLNGERVSIRFVGIDAPESYTTRTGYRECYGTAAKDHMKAILQPGMRVYLEKDITDRDRYDRLLRYVWVDGGDTGLGPHGQAVLLNTELVHDGYAIPYPYKPDIRDQPVFDAAAGSAKQDNAGMWCACGGQRIPEDQTRSGCSTT